MAGDVFTARWTIVERLRARASHVHARTVALSVRSERLHFYSVCRCVPQVVEMCVDRTHFESNRVEESVPRQQERRRVLVTGPPRR